MARMLEVIPRFVIAAALTIDLITSTAAPVSSSIIS
jgi:hypothetical protein